MYTYLFCSDGGSIRKAPPVNTSDGSSIKKVPPVINTLTEYNEDDGEPFKPKTETSHQISITLEPYTTSDIEDKDLGTFSSLVLSSAFDKLELFQSSDTYDKLATQKVRYVYTYIYCVHMYIQELELLLLICDT